MRGFVEETVKTAADVGYRSFSRCPNLKHVVLDVGCFSVGSYAFSGCASLSSIDLSTVQSVGKHAFYRCASLTSADLGSARSIGYGAFSGTGLQEITFGGHLSYVDPKAFFGYKFMGAGGERIGATAGNFSDGHFLSVGGKTLKLDS
jgi:hypothetical protein